MPANATTQLAARTTRRRRQRLRPARRPFPYVEDSTPPGGPRDHRHRPRLPANDNNPEVKGTTGAAPRPGRGCTRTPTARARRAPADGGAFAVAGITVAVPSNATTQLSAPATDAAGNDSTCSALVLLRRGLDGPGGPRDHRHRPGLPANDNNPEVKGTTGAGSTVVASTRTLVLGLAGGQRHAGAVRGAGITVAVPANATTQLQRDAPPTPPATTPPARPASPTSRTRRRRRPRRSPTPIPTPPSNDNDPEVKGTTGAGSPVTVELYTNASCSGSPAATGTAAAFARPGSPSRSPTNPTTRSAPSPPTPRATPRAARARSPTSRTRRRRRPRRSPTPTPTRPPTTTTPRSRARPARAPTGRGSTRTHRAAGLARRPPASPAQFAGAGITVAVADERHDHASAPPPPTPPATTPPARPLVHLRRGLDGPAAPDDHRHRSRLAARTTTTRRSRDDRLRAGSTGAICTRIARCSGLRRPRPERRPQFAARRDHGRGRRRLDDHLQPRAPPTRPATPPPARRAVTYVEDSTAPAAPSDHRHRSRLAGSTTTTPRSRAPRGAARPSGRALHERRLHRLPGRDRQRRPASRRRDHRVRRRRHADPQLSATATDAAGNTSDCSASFTYTEDSTAPAAPTITDTDPDSPSNDNTPEVKGTAGAGSPTAVKLYTNGDLHRRAAATGSAGAASPAPGSRSP